MIRRYEALPKFKHLRFVGDRESPLAKWSGIDEPPAVGDTVNVMINGIGPAVVLDYFTEHGYLGVRVRCTRPPAWMLEQNGHPFAHVFGAEIEKVTS